MNSNEKIKMNIFGKERELKIILVGDNDSEDLYNDEEFVKLMPEEERGTFKMDSKCGFYRI